MHKLRNVRTVAMLAALATLLLATSAQAQFTSNPTDLPTIKTPTQGAVQNGATPDQVRDLLWLRYLQGRSRGRVRTGVPQFVPFGSLGYGNFPGMNGFVANANQQQGSSNGGGQAGSGQAGGGGAGGAAPDPAADPLAQDPQASKRMTVAERRAQAEAAREARRQATRERAQRRLEEAAARAKALAAQPKAGADPAP